MKYFLHIDDHEVVRAGLKNVLLDIYHPCQVIEAEDETTAIERLKQHVFDLVIMDIQMPGADTLGLLEFVKNNYPDTKVLIFSMSAENIYAQRFLKAGAMGFVSKNSGLTELKKAIDLVLKNRRYISESLSELLLDQIVSEENNNPFARLSSRELNIASFLLKGNTITEIADILNLGISTVGTYKARLFEKLKIKNLTELIEMGKVYKVL